MAHPAGESATILQDFVNVLKIEANESEKAAENTMMAAQNTMTAAQNEIAATEGVFIKFGWLVAAAGVIAAFFGISSMREIKGHAERSVNTATAGAQQTLDNAIGKLTKAAETAAEELKKDAQKVTNDAIGKSINELREKSQAATKDTIERSMTELREKSRAASDDIAGLSKKIGQQADDFEKTMREKINDFISSYQSGLDKLLLDQASRLQAPPPTASAFAGKSIIWVDNQPETTLVARHELERQGVYVEAPESTEQLKALLENQPAGRKFSLIVSDMRRGEGEREGLNYFQTIIARKDYPPRLIFAPISLLHRGTVENDIRKLKQVDDRFLGAFSSKDDAFAEIFRVLRADADKGKAV